MAYDLGIDVGGTHITLDLVDAKTFEILRGATLRCPLNTHTNPLSVLSVFESAISRIAAKVGADAVNGVGLGIPGPFQYEEGICRITPAQNKYEQLFGVNFRLFLRHALGADKPVIFLNDAASFALGEYFKGGAKGFNRPVVVTLGTGFGASFLKDGRPQTVGDEVPKGGELWHIPYRTGIADDFFSTRRLVADWKRLTGEEIAGGKEIAMAAQQGNQTAIRIYADFGKDLAEFVAPWLDRFGADAFVIGGNLAKDWDLFIQAFQSELDRRLPGHKIAVKPCELGEQAPVCGAALSQTLMAPKAPAPYARIPTVEQLVAQMGDARLVQLDGGEKFPWKSLVSELDLALRAKGKKTIWYEAASASDGRGGVDPELAKNFTADPFADLCVIYGHGASEIPWEGSLAFPI